MKKICIYLIASVMLFNATYFSRAEEYQYDEKDRLVKIIYDDGSYIEYVYDITGNIVKEIHKKKSEDVDGSSGGDSDGGNNGETPSPVPNQPIEPSTDPKVEISTSKQSDGQQINATIETKSTDKKITTTIEISNDDIQKAIKNKKDLFINYDGVVIKIKRSQLKRADKNKNLIITISRNKSVSLEQVQHFLKKKQKVKRIEFEFNIRIESRKQIEFESIYIPQNPDDLANYRLYEIKGKDTKIKNITTTNDGSIKIKGKSSNRLIGIVVLENI